MRHFFIVVLSIACTFFSNNVYSAEFLQHSTDPLSFSDLFQGRCTHTMRGPIEAGDADRLATTIASLPGQDHDALNFLLCLESPGGSLGEAISMGEVLGGSYFGTYVAEGVECLSACAVLFMHGRIGLFEDVMNFRMLHPSARLGFHAPRLDLDLDPSLVVPAPLVQSAYRSAIQSIADLSRASSAVETVGNMPVFPVALLQEMLNTPPDQFRHVETLHDAFSWGIDIFPANLTAPSDFELSRGFYQLCVNSAYELSPNSNLVPEFIDVTPQLHVIHQNAPSHFSSPSPPNGHTLITFDGPIEEQCSYQYMDHADPPGFEVIYYTEGAPVGRTFLWPVYLFAPSTPISNLVAGQDSPGDRKR